MVVLSIIVPIFNKEKYIDSCIESILKQSYTNFELILVNDGSTDKSGEKCNNYSNLDNRIVIVHQENKGVSAARNRGVEIAKGKYIGFVDSDDIVEPDMYELLIHNILSYNADISICGLKKVFSNKQELYYGTERVFEFSRDQAISGLFRKEIQGSVYDKIYKAEIVKNIKFEGSFYEDIFYNFLIFLNTKKSIFHDVIKYNYIIRDNSISMSKFSLKNMESISFSQRMIEICKSKAPECTDNAIIFHIITNISVLNLLLLSKKSKNSDEYKVVVKNLDEYSSFIKNKKEIKIKHKLAFILFKRSSTLYSMAMKLYCVLTNADAIRRV